MTKEYLFGDTDLAAHRLEVLAEVFAASSRAFVSESAVRCERLAVDLGCGPGYTTHLLADTIKCAHTVGLDNSKHFISLSGMTATENISFQLHDVTRVPFPVGPCDLIYARFLLTHQLSPETLIAKWTTQLSHSGQLLLEEVNSIDIKVAVFAEYMEIVDAMLADAGHDLYVGPKLDAMATSDAIVRRSNQVACVAVTNSQAARMFSMNIQTWKDNAFVQQNYSPASIRKLEQELSDLAAKPTSEIGIEWHLRQLVYERES